MISCSDDLGWGPPLNNTKPDGTPLVFGPVAYGGKLLHRSAPPWQWMRSPKNEGLYDDFPWSTRRFAGSMLIFRGVSSHFMKNMSPHVLHKFATSSFVSDVTSMPFMEFWIFAIVRTLYDWRSLHNQTSTFDSHPSIKWRSLTGVMMCDVFLGTTTKPYKADVSQALLIDMYHYYTCWY